MEPSKCPLKKPSWKVDLVLTFLCRRVGWLSMRSARKIDWQLNNLLHLEMLESKTLCKDWRDWM